MALPANVTPLEEGRALTEERVLYRSVNGKQKETYLGIPYSLLAHLYEASLAEVRMLLYVWQRTGGWKDYHSHPQPMRITFAEWTSGRPGYAQDTGAHLCKQEVATTRDALVARGWLYEEWETPHERGPRRYALIAPDNPGIGPYLQEGGRWEVLLLTNEGPQPYLIPEAVLQDRTEGATLLQHRKDALLHHRKGSPTTQESVVLQHRTEKARRSFPGAGRAQPITNSLANSSSKEALAKGAADAAPTPEHVHKEIEAEKTGSPPPFQQGSNVETLHSGVGGAPPTVGLISKLPLFPVSDTGNPPDHLSIAHSGKRAKKEPTPEAITAAERKAEERAALNARKAAMTAIWLAHPKTIQLEEMSETERRRFYSGIAKLAQSSLTLEELPDLLGSQARWSRGTYTPDPHTMEASLGTLRREVATWKKKGAEPQKGDNDDGRNGTHRGSANGQHPAGLAGTGGANHEGDAAIIAAVQRVRARQSQEAAACAETHDDTAGR